MVNGEFYNIVLRQTTIFVSECWTLNKIEGINMKVVRMKILRCISVIRLGRIRNTFM